MKVTEKAYAKINLCLNVSEGENGFHNIETLVSTVNLFDKIKLYSRKDKKVTLKPMGTVKEYIYNCNPERDNAYKAAVAFMEKYNTNGVDIVLYKHIPLSSGMGGSSTCISAVLRGMKKLYGIEDDLSDLANSLGSDTNYLLKGGLAILRGRGDIVEYFEDCPPRTFVAVFPENGVDTTECYKMFDKVGSDYEKSDVISLKDSMYKEEILYSECKNMLEKSACHINGEVKRAIDTLKSLSPSAVFMTGSGSTVCAFFPYDGLCSWAQEKLSKAGFLSECLTTIEGYKD